MIFLSAQPDEFYFTWQLELQIYNFNKLGISPQNIHILFSCNPSKGVQGCVRDFIKANQTMASFFIYPDERENKEYVPSIRPHIIKQHFVAFEYLQKETIFYHDSDIVFRTLPNFEKLRNDKFWYASDTSSYLNTDYIISVGGEELLSQMCAVVGVSIETIIELDNNCGGAQWLLKDTPISFWDKLEKDSEALYIVMENFNLKLTMASKNAFTLNFLRPKEIQSWCSDMWALLWNSRLFNKKVLVHEELKFCWADSDIRQWNNSKILHYSGHIEEGDQSRFRKSNYTFFEPFYDLKLNDILASTCSYELVKMIKEFIAKKDTYKIDFTDVSFLLMIDCDTITLLDNVYTTLLFLYKYFRTNIYVLEIGIEQRFSSTQFPFVNYEYISRTKYSGDYKKNKKFLIKKSKTKITFFLNYNFIIPIQQIKKAVHLVRNKNMKLIFPNDGIYYKLDMLASDVFNKILDDRLLLSNLNKFRKNNESTCEVILVCKKKNYLRVAKRNVDIQGVNVYKSKRRTEDKVIKFKGALFKLFTSNNNK